MQIPVVTIPVELRDLLSSNTDNQTTNNSAFDSTFDSGGSGGGSNGGGDGSGGDGGSGATTVRVFGVGGRGTKFMYVFDRSSSMTGQKLQEVKAELLKSLSALNRQHQFNIIFYDDHFDVWKPGGKLVAANASNKSAAEGFVKAIAAQGGTTHLPPLLEAIRYKPEVIFFLTDGQSLKQTELEEICRQSGKISINVIQYDDGSDGKSEILRQLASRNRGQYKYINVASPDAL
jgi:uncharacterized protein YegL